MRRKDIMAGLEIARTAVSMVAVEAKNGEFNILNAAKVECSDGIKNGAVINLDSITEAIFKLIEEYNQKNTKRINCAFVNISGTNIKKELIYSAITLPQRGCEITQRHIEDLIESCKIASIPLDRSLLYILPLEYILDSQGGIRNPLGLCGTKLEAKLLIITAPFNQVQNIVKAVNFAGLEVKEVVLTAMANFYSISTQENRRQGVLLIDLKTDLTEISIFKGDSFLFFDTIPKGQSDITDEIAKRFDLPFETAEHLKIKYGFLNAGRAMDDRNNEGIPLEWMGRRQNVLRGELNNIIHEQLEIIFSRVLDKIKEYKDFNNIVKNGGLATGGCVSMEGFLEWASDRLGFLVRQGMPLGLNEGFITALGLAKFGAEKSQRPDVKRNGRFFNKVIEKAGELLMDYF